MTLASIVVVGMLSAPMLSACSSSSKASGASTTSSAAANQSAGSGAPGGVAGSKKSSSTPTTATAAKGGWPTPSGCDKPSVADVSKASGLSITQATPGDADGCIWGTTDPATGVQVSYHRTGTPDALHPEMFGYLKSSGKVTQLDAPGSTDAFIRTPSVAPGASAPIAYIEYPQGVVMIAFSKKPGQTWDTANLKAVVQLILAN